MALAGGTANAAVDSITKTSANDDNKNDMQQRRRAVLESFLKGDGMMMRGGGRKKPLLHQQGLDRASTIHRMNLLKNNKNGNDDRIPCVPTTDDEIGYSTTQSLIGVLSCGEDEYCAESDMSNLGGFCQKQQQPVAHEEGDDDRRRRLQSCWDAVSYCSGTEPDLDYCADYDQVLPTCECGAFNVTGGAGSITCQVPNYCIVNRPILGFAPCEPTCYDAISSRTYSATSNSSITCTVFTAPYTQTLCFGYSETLDKYGEAIDKSCNISFDGIYCDSCSVANLMDTPQSNPQHFDAWNCTNVGLGASPTDASFASRFLVRPPLLIGDPDCSKTNSPTMMMTPSPTESPMALVPVTIATPAPSSATITSRSAAVVATAVGATLWSMVAAFGA